MATSSSGISVGKGPSELWACPGGETGNDPAVLPVGPTALGMGRDGGEWGHLASGHSSFHSVLPSLSSTGKWQHFPCCWQYIAQERVLWLWKQYTLLHLQGNFNISCPSVWADCHLFALLITMIPSTLASFTPH